MKVGDLVLSKAYQNYADILPAKLVVQTTLGDQGHRGGTRYIVTADDPEDWKPANNFFVVSSA
tara:strand:+ start:159 stop:347 length:189 start_codon:yes stop_codon:yes gene_type:complete